MKKFLIDNVVSPTLMAMAELCEKNGINCIFYVEHHDGLLDTVITHHLDKNASDEAKNALKAIEGRE